MNDTISRKQAIDALSHMCSEDENGITVSKANVDSMLRYLPPIQPEPAIPLQWIESQIEWLKSLDNAFTTLTARQISSMVNKWRDEQDG